MLMMGECMEIDPAKRGKRSEELELLAGTECPIPSRHPRLRFESLPHSLLTGCGASCLHSLHWKWSGKWQSCHVWLRDKSAYRFIRELDVSLFFQIDHEGWVGVFADSIRHGSQQNLSLTITEWVTHKTMAVKKFSSVNIPIDSGRLHALLFVNAKSCSTDKKCWLL